MKRIVVVLAVLFAAFSLGVTAQVTIGTDNDPHPGAVLDLQSTKGFKLPTVDILDANVFQLSGDGSAAAGMMVYNTYAQMADGQGEGVYFWSGSTWMVVAVAHFTGPTTVEGYNVYCYPNHLGCWMTDNSRLGTPTRKRFGYAANEATPETISGTNPNASSGARGYYYTWDNASGACPSGYHLPTTAQWYALKSYLNGGSATAAEKEGWFSASELAGHYRISDSMWLAWGSVGYWWSNAYFENFHADTSAMYGPSEGISNYFSVRCVKSN